MTIERIDGCIGCGSCVSACATDVIRLSISRQKAVIKYPDDCQICYLCVFYCPVSAITVTPDKKTSVIVSWS
jgi:NAD-dependent dihydropyrimidine dehydrogenase PreA subunit